MANNCDHIHKCFETGCGKTYTCWNPECLTLPGAQGLCPRCSYLYGWSKSKDKESNDWSAL